MVAVGCEGVLYPLPVSVQHTAHVLYFAIFGNVNGGEAMDDFLTLQQAADLMGVHRITVWRLVRAGKLQMYQSETNRRVKLVKRSDVEALVRPRPIEVDEGKAAA
jgi:excisionase family DNA binding protein